MALVRVTAAKELKEGDVIRFTCNGRGRGGHYGVTATVTRVNRKTVKAIEKEGSYQAGTRWSVSVNEYVDVCKVI